MNKRGFTLIEVMVSIVLILSILYGLSIVPTKLSQIKGVIVTEYDSDLSVLKLKKTIDNKILYGGIVASDNKLTIGNSTYPLIDGTIELQGIDEKVNYSSIDNFAVFSLDSSPEKQIKYLETFSSYTLREGVGNER